MNNLKIHAMTINDLEKFLDRLYEDFDDFWQQETLIGELENENSKYIVAEINNEIVGFAGIWKAVYDMHITNIVVRKDFRSRGIGKLLIERLIQMSKNEDIASITLEVNKKNIPAIKLYEKFGFKNVGARKNYYKGIDDAIIMTMEVTNEEE